MGSIFHHFVKRLHLKHGSTYNIYTFPIMSIIPHSLVMHSFKCDYCDCSNEDDILETSVGCSYGIYHCKAHASNAEKDCKVFLARMQTIPFAHVVHDSSSVVTKLLQYLSEHRYEVHRSDGTIDADWRPCSSYGLDMCKFICKPGGNWYIGSEKGELCKMAALNDIKVYFNRIGNTAAIHLVEECIVFLQRYLDAMSIL
jgi:hypothetical protein